MKGRDFFQYPILRVAIRAREPRDTVGVHHRRLVFQKRVQTKRTAKKTHTTHTYTYTPCVINE